MAGDIVNVSWGDHIEWGEGVAALRSPEQVAAGVRRWKEQAGASKVYWRGCNRFISQYTRTFTRPGAPPRRYYTNMAQIEMDEFQTICDAAHGEGLPAYLYLAIFDEGWPLLDGQDDKYTSWQSEFTVAHPEYLARDRTGSEVHHGVMCYAYPEVRAYKLQCIREILADYPFDGIFICTRSQSKPAAHADQFGFNEPVVEAYQQRYGVNILEQDFDVEAWRRLRGEFVTQFLRELRSFTRERGLRLSIGVPQGDYLGPPIGNLHLDWRSWVAGGVIDELVINQVAVRCPSIWRPLWPGHTGYGYVQNYVDGIGLPPLDQDVRTNYGPYCAQHGCELSISRLHWPEDAEVEAHLRGLPGVSGLMMSSFRKDNQVVIERNGLERTSWFEE
jgi:hypothetical protein